MQVSISVEQLHSNLSRYKVIDASWYLPGQDRDGFEEYKAAHIPGAVFFDIDKIADHNTDLPHMAPSAEVFSEAVGQMGISNSDTVVVYDGAGLFSAARVWYLFRAMGHETVYLLDGGMPAWIAAGYSTEAGISTPEPQTYTVDFDATAFVTAETVRETQAQILDARPPARFQGTAEEPRAGVRKGHIPGSTNLFFGDLVQDGKLKSVEEIEAILSTKDVNGDQPIITSCGSGVTAAVLAAGLAKIGKLDVQIYDGSWSEWGSRTDLPIETGEG